MNGNNKTDFDKLLAIFKSPNSRERLYKIKTRLDIADNDAIWMYFNVFEYYARLYEKMPIEIGGLLRELTEASDSLVKLGTHNVNKAMTEALVGLAEAEANMKKEIGTATAEEARKIAKKALEEIEGSQILRHRINAWLSITFGTSTWIVATAISISIADFVTGLESKMSGVKFVDYLYHLPAGHLLIVADLTIAVLLGLKHINKKSVTF